MKKCRRCAKPATLHVTEIRGGEAQAIHLCESCAQDYLGSGEKSGSVEQEDNDVAKKIGALVNEQELDELDQLLCPNCGISFGEFRSQGRLGCPQDYVVFEQELMPLLENIHGETQHGGKFPKRAPDASRRQYQLIRLRNELRQSIEDEDYETAAGLRDEIQLLEAELGAVPGRLPDTSDD